MIAFSVELTHKDVVSQKCQYPVSKIMEVLEGRISLCIKTNSLSPWENGIFCVYILPFLSTRLVDQNEFFCVLSVW